MYLSCINCGAKYPLDDIIYTCKKCGDILEVKYELVEVTSAIASGDWKGRPINVWKYREFLPIRHQDLIVSLNEGGTTLHRCKRLGEELGLKKLYVKNEGENPTGSFKDRGMTVGVTKALELKAKIVACASTGNTSASLAAYSAKAGLGCMVIIPSGKIAMGKLAQAMMHGAKVISVKGNFDIAFAMILEVSNRYGVYLLNSINPFRLEGQKTAAFEVCEQLGWSSPSAVVIPVGNAGNISAYWKGFREFEKLDIVKASPRMIGVQAEGAQPIAKAVLEGRQEIEPVIEPETVASAIRIGRPVSWKKALNAIYDSKGTARTVTDKEILAAQKLLARKEGLFVEPASAASLAGLRKIVEEGILDRDEPVVCVTTGHGLKDPETAIQNSESIVEISPEIGEVLKVLEQMR
jgi:threonine synthase